MSKTNTIEVPEIDVDANELLAMCASCGAMIVLKNVGADGQSTWDSWYGECPTCEAEISYECPGTMTCEYTPKELRLQAEANEH